jgi:SOS-response transcriptional repressor LexA
MSGVTSWNSELPSGRNPFWIKDESLATLGLHAGDVVGVDTRREPSDGDLALVEVETDELADRLVRRYFAAGPDGVRLVAPGADQPELRLAPDQLIVLGVVCSRVRFETGGGQDVRVVEEPLDV